jgi:hypothetical protein
MKVVPLDIGLEKDVNRYMFLIFLFHSWIFEKTSKFMQKWIQPPACSDHGLHRILSSYWLAHFYLMKKSAKVLLYFVLDCGMLEFLTDSSVEKIPVWALANHNPNKQEVGFFFAWSGSELWTLI